MITRRGTKRTGGVGVRRQPWQGEGLGEVIQARYASSWQSAYACPEEVVRKDAQAKLKNVGKKLKNTLENRGIDPRASPMLRERSTI